MIVAEFDEQRCVIELFDYRADLAECKPLRRKITQQSHHVQQ
ncbi:MAG TPA: hypothetical protein VE821_03090 [Pyrinomonadaceae bacterium]|nr:hypothetical protein [Pyrinomonadaceae bacterium]